MSLETSVNERLDLGYDYGASGGPEWSTNIVEMASGFESRNANWSAARGRWDIGARDLLKPKFDYILGFFRARRGRAVAFRFKDWSDWKAVNSALAPTGAPTVQLVKPYSSSVGSSDVRTIKRPVSGTVTFKRGGTPYTPASVDYSTGIVTLTVDASIVISTIAKDSYGTATATNHPFTTGQSVYITGAGGMTQLNNRVFVVTKIDANTFQLNENTTGYANYTANSATARRYVQPSESLTWSGEFDVLARFDSDSLKAEFLAYRQSDGLAIYRLDSLPVVEVRE